MIKTFFQIYPFSFPLSIPYFPAPPFFQLSSQNSFYKVFITDQRFVFCSFIALRIRFLCRKTEYISFAFRWIVESWKSDFMIIRRTTSSRNTYRKVDINHPQMVFWLIKDENDVKWVAIIYSAFSPICLSLLSMCLANARNCLLSTPEQ